MGPLVLFALLLGACAIPLAGCFRFCRPQGSSLSRSWQCAKQYELPSSGMAAAEAGFAAPLKVLLVVEPSPFSYISGYANRFKETIRALRQAGDQVEVVTTEPSGSAPEAGMFLDCNVHNIPGVSFPWYSDVSVALHTAGRMAKVISSFRPDVLHVSSPSMLLFSALRCARRFNVPLLMSYHTDLVNYARCYLPYTGMSHLAKYLVRRVHSAADLTLCTSPQLQQQLDALGVSRVDVWRKGINTDQFAPTFRSQQTRNLLSANHPDQPLLLFVGRLGIEKRVHRLQQVLQDNPTARLAIVGSGPYESTLRKIFQGLPVVFTGPLQGTELSQAFASADIFVMPSDTETLGFVALEAMASGVPVVAARAGGLLDIVQDGRTGFLAPSADDNMDDFSARVRQLVADRELRTLMGHNARAYSLGWSWEAATRQLRNAHYRKAIEHHAAKSR